MIPAETGKRKGGLKSDLLERLYDPLQLRIITIGVVLLVGYGGVYMPLSARIAETTKTVNREQKMSQLASSLEQLQAQCGRFAKRLPQQTDSKEWMQYMHEGIRRFPLKLSKLDCLAPKQIGPYQIVVLKIELEGTFFDLDQFLRWLELNPRLLRMDEISIGIAKDKEKGTESKDDMVMNLTVLGMGG